MQRFPLPPESLSRYRSSSSSLRCESHQFELVSGMFVISYPRSSFKDMAFPKRHRFFRRIITSLEKSVWLLGRIIECPERREMGQTCSQYTTFTASQEIVSFSQSRFIKYGLIPEKHCISVNRSGSLGNATSSNASWDPAPVAAYRKFFESSIYVSSSDVSA
jgi:hypothetical protein